MKRVFGLVEAIFDSLYLLAAVTIGLVLLLTGSGSLARVLCGVMALVLAGGDSFHLLPRIAVIRSGREERYRAALGRGKLITSITMTLFYLLLWHVGILVFGQSGGMWSYILYALAAVRILLCLMPQNAWFERYPPVSWGIARNIPFFAIAAIITVFFYGWRTQFAGFDAMWLAIVLSFACYLPVVLWSNRNPKIGMLMFPKTCAYLWMLAMFLSV